MMSNNMKLRSTPTDKEELEEARELIRYLKLQLKLKVAHQSVETHLAAPTTAETFKRELSAVKAQHTEEVKGLQEHVKSLKADMAALQEEHRKEVERHQETLEDLGNVLRTRQKEHYQTLNDFTHKLARVGAIHKDAIDIHKETIRCLEVRHHEALAQQRAELLAGMMPKKKETRDPPTVTSEVREADSGDWRDPPTVTLDSRDPPLEVTTAKSKDPLEGTTAAKLKEPDVREAQALTSNERTTEPKDFPISKITIQSGFQAELSQVSSYDYAE